MAHRKKNEKEPVISPEVSYLIEDVEELVNKNIGRYLEHQPFQISLCDFTPALTEIDGRQRLPAGIEQIAEQIVNQVAPGEREFTGIDLSFTFPLEKAKAELSPLGVTLKWSDGIQSRLAVINNRSLVLVQNATDNDRILSSTQLRNHEMGSYLETIGLPSSIWSDDFKDLLGDIYFSRDIKIHRHTRTILDLATTLEISHDARYMTNDHGEKELVQELCLNIDHQGEDYVDGMYFPGRPMFRNMLRFDQTQDATSWQYRGLYHGHLDAGELINEVVQMDPKLGIPAGKLIDKALYFLTENE